MEWFDKILEDGGDDKAKIAELFKAEFPKHAIPKEQYNKKVDDLKLIDSELTEAKKQIESTTEKIAEFSALVGENDELKTANKAIGDELTEFKSGETTRTATAKKAHAVEKQLLSEGANSDALGTVMGAMELDKITVLENGNLDGYDAQRDIAKASKPKLFPTIDTNSPQPPSGDPIPPAKEGGSWWASKKSK